MERDSLLAHGAAYLLHDRLHTCSDYTVMEVCAECGSLLSPVAMKTLAAAGAMGAQMLAPMLDGKCGLSGCLSLQEPCASCRWICSGMVRVMPVCTCKNITLPSFAQSITAGFHWWQATAAASWVCSKSVTCMLYLRNAAKVPPFVFWNIMLSHGMQQCMPTAIAAIKPARWPHHGRQCDIRCIQQIWRLVWLADRSPLAASPV